MECGRVDRPYRVMKPFPLWKTLVIVLACVLGALYAAPNLFGEDPAVQISVSEGALAALDAPVAEALDAAEIPYLSSRAEGDRWVCVLPTPMPSSTRPKCCAVNSAAVGSWP